MGLTRLGGVRRWHVDWVHFWGWLQAAPLGDALAGILRWTMLALAWWLLASSVLYSVARLSKVPALIRGTGWLTVPFVRFAVDRALVVTLAASTVVGARAGAAFAQTPTGPPVARATVSASPTPGWNGAKASVASRATALPVVDTVALRSPEPATASLGAPPLAAARQCEVQVDDNLWSIAAAHLAEVTGQDASSLGAGDIASYWWGVVDANRATLRSGHPNLLYPGEVVVLPAVMATGDGFAAGSTVVAPSASAPASSAPAAPSAPSAPSAPVSASAPLPAPPAATVAPSTPAATTTPTPIPVTTPTTIDAAPTSIPAAPSRTVVSPAAAPAAGPGSTAATRTPAPAGRSAADKRRARPVVAVNPWALRAGMAGALGLPVLALGGWLAKLRRGRVVQASRVRPGQDVVRTEPELEPLERTARIIVADQAEEWIDATLRALSASLAESSLVAVPEVRCVRAGDMGVEVLLGEPSSAAPEGWEVADGGHLWRVPADVELDELIRRGEGYPAFAPALVSLGATPEGPILVDLEGLGVLSVEGDADRARAFLSGAALELYSATWAQGIDLRVYGLSGFEGLDGVAVTDGASLVREVASMARLVGDGLGTATAVSASRTGDGEPCYPTVVVVGPDVDATVVDELVKVGARRAGVAVVGVGPLQAVGWQLVVAAEGAAMLKPLGLGVRVAGVANVASSFAGEGSGRSQHDEEPDSPPEDPTVAAATPTTAALVVDQAGLDQQTIDAAVRGMAAVEDLTEVTPTAPTSPAKSGQPTLRRRQDCEVWVSVLRRRPEVSGAPQIKGRKLIEVLVYLAVYGAERLVPSGELRTNCWIPKPAPATDEERRRFQEVTPKAVYEAMSRLRKQLGEGTRGWHLPVAVDGAYGIGAGVGCDWTLFRGLVQAAADAVADHDTDRALALYREALELVQGDDPFADVLTSGPADSDGPYAWAESRQLVTDIRLAVGKTVKDAAALATPVDPRLAVWATEVGLEVLPLQLTLFDLQMVALAELGDAAGLERTQMAKCWAHEQLDPDGGVPPETVELYRHLMAKMAQRETVESAP